MTDVIKTGRKPNFTGNGVAVWVNKTKDGQQYLSISLFGGEVKLAAFKYKPLESKPKELTTVEPKVVQSSIEEDIGIEDLDMPAGL